MLRRCVLRRSPIAAKLVTSTPIYETLQGALATSRFDSTNQEVASMVAELHQHHFFNLGCWRSASKAARNKFAESSEEAKVAANILDTALERSEEQLNVPKVLVAYGSQSGSAEALAKWTAVMANTNTELVPVLVTMNEAAEILKDTERVDNFQAAVFLTSTYGVGGFPINARKFVSSLKNGELTGRLSKIPHSVIGLGNSNSPYEYCGAAKTLSQELKKVGSEELLPATYSCELANEGHDAAFRNWKKDLWNAISNKGISKTVDAAGVEEVADVYNVEFIFSTKKVDTLRKNNGRRVDWFEAPVTWNFLLTEKGYTPRFREMTVELDLVKNTEILGRKLAPTDHLLVHPSVPKPLVDRALKRFGLNGEEIVEAIPKPGAPSSFFDGKKVTTRTLFTEIVDIAKMPSRSVLASLVSACRNESEKAALQKLATDESEGNEYSQLTASGKYFSIVDCLEKFPSINLTLAQALTRFGTIQPRKYSSCKNSATLSNKFEICYKVAEGVVPGLATTTLESCVPGLSSIWCSLEEGLTTMPANETDALFVALGSGVGLVRNALQGRALAKAAGQPVGKAIVIAGCRHAGKDDLFKEEFEQMKKDGLITDLRYVASYDSDKFVSPFNAIDADVAKFVNNGAEVCYFGMGGSIPRTFVQKLDSVGVNTNKLRDEGKIHEEFFSSSVADEKLVQAAQK